VNPKRDRPAGAAGNEEFLSRWSRLKQDARTQPPEKTEEKAADPNASPPELPPVDKLTFESDYRDFMHPKVGDDVRRAALKKLFSDPHFSAIDMMDVYIDDYSQNDPIPAAMLKQLRQAQKILDWASGKDDAAEETAEAKPAGSPVDVARIEDGQSTAPVAAGPMSGEAGSAPDAVPVRDEEASSKS